MENEWTDAPYTMICGSAEAEKRQYKKLKGKSGRTWLVANQKDPASNIYVSAHPMELVPGYKGFMGFGGRTLSFMLEDGSVEELRGPWHANADSLFADTGYDIRDKHLTFGVIGLNREYRNGCYGGVTITGVIYKDDDWVVGKFNRIMKLAQELANSRNERLCYFQKSAEGSCCCFVNPKKEEQTHNTRTDRLNPQKSNSS